ncbi:MAG: TIM barrel protein [Clostridia bacterium]|nr:TIM barrel protein [Clostridia bacterium]
MKAFDSAYPYRLGLVSISFRDRTPEEILIAMQKAQLSYVEWGSDVHAPCRDKKRLAELVRLQNAYGITCSSYGTYFRLGETPLEELTDYIAAAKILGTDILRLWCGRKSGAACTEEEKKALLAQCKAAASIAEENNITFCLECHIKTFTERMEDALWLIREVESPYFQMYWQPNQFRTVEENLTYAKAISPYAKVLHVFNWKEHEKNPLAEAIDIWKDYLSCFDGSQTLLLEHMPDGKLAALAREAEALVAIAMQAKNAAQTDFY